MIISLRKDFQKEDSFSIYFFHSFLLLFFPGHVQRGRVPGKEPGHPPGRHRCGPENLGEQTPAAAVFQPADQNRFVAIQQFECGMNSARLLATIETEKTFPRWQTIANNTGASFFLVCITAPIVLVSPASPVNVQVSGFLKEAARRHLLPPPLLPNSPPPGAPPTPHCWFQASVRRTRVNLHSPLSPERLSSLHGALFLFSLSCPSWFPHC